MTDTTLIPKENIQTTMKDWCPISLCNVLYKFISKVLSNRLKLILSQCISDTHSAFVPLRTILDNATVAFQVIHYMKNKKSRNDGCVALKLDINKAYDRMDSDYLKGVTVKMVFSEKWIEWMSLCIESVDYSILVNNEMGGPIIPDRGPCQGDPLPPHLFIIGAEGLSALIRDAEERQIIIGTSICRGAPSISHLLFADDCFMFFKAEESQAHAMKNILTVYEAVSGQPISLPKLEIYYSRNVSSELKGTIADTMGVQSVLGTGKYLGLPSMIDRDKKSTFGYIKDQVWNHINSWISKCLSKAGQEVMIKSVLQAIPTYVMSLFQLPTTLITNIEIMMNAFWWGHGGENNCGIHWLSWEKLSMYKTHGGWVLKTYRCSILLCSENSDGNYKLTQRHWSLAYSKHDTSLPVLILMHVWVTTPAMFGVVFSGLGLSSEVVRVGSWAQVNLFQFLTNHGCKVVSVLMVICMKTIFYITT